MYSDTVVVAESDAKEPDADVVTRTHRFRRHRRRPVRRISRLGAQSSPPTSCKAPCRASHPGAPTLPGAPTTTVHPGRLHVRCRRPRPLVAAMERALDIAVQEDGTLSRR